MKQRRLTRVLTTTAAVLLLLFSLVGCGASNSTAASTGAAVAPQQNFDAATTAEAGLTDTAAQDRKLITNAEVNLETTTFEDAMAQIEQQVTALGGYLASNSRSGEASAGSRNARYEARIPADSLSQFLAGAEKAGTVVYTNQSTVDVTNQYVDNEAHLNSLKAQEARLLELMASAEKLEDIIALEDKLTDVRYQIDSLTGQQKLYDNQVAYATVTVSVQEVKSETVLSPSFGQRIVKALSGSVENAVNFAQNLVIFLIYLLPFLLVLALVAVVVLLLSARARRRRKPRAAAGAPAQMPQPPTDSDKPQGTNV